MVLNQIEKKECDILEEYRSLTMEEFCKEIGYKKAKAVIEILLAKGCITAVEYAQINQLNLESFSPKYKELYS